MHAPQAFKLQIAEKNETNERKSEETSKAKLNISHTRFEAMKTSLIWTNFPFKISAFMAKCREDFNNYFKLHICLSCLQLISSMEHSRENLI